MLDAVPEERAHLVQFTDMENASTYGCCLTVTRVLQVRYLIRRRGKYKLRLRVLKL